MFVLSRLALILKQTEQIIVTGAMYFCGFVKLYLTRYSISICYFLRRTFSVTANSRMMYAFARDGGIPGHKFFHKVDAKRKSPIRTSQSQPYRASLCFTHKHLIVSMACMYSELYIGVTQLGKCCRLLCCHQYCYNWAVYFIW